jgi:hypothetical protein
MSKTRWLDIAAIALAIAVLAGLGFVTRPQQTPTIAVAPSEARVDRPGPPAKDRSSVLFISDSYSAGSGLDENYYGCTAALRMGWLCNLSAEPGTGYISGGTANRFDLGHNLGMTTSFGERVSSLARKYNPNLVILDGGRNDLFAPFDAIFDAMSSVIKAVHQAWPDARIAMIRPRFLDRPDDDLGYDNEFMARLEGVPSAEGMVVLDPISRFIGTDTSAMLPSGQRNPNQQGETALSASLVDALSDNGFTPTT